MTTLSKNRAGVATILVIGFLAFCLPGFSGCSGTYGRLSVNSDVKEIYENFQVLSDYRYFRSGPASRPRVVIGLREDFTLQSDYWQPIELTPEMLDQWLGFRGHHKKYFLGNNGFDILDGQGNKLGIWYGLVDAHDWAAVRMIADKTVSITPPIQDGRRLRAKFIRE